MGAETTSYRRGAANEPKALGILERIKAIFASKGFERASMQDLARAAGMSAGNFYRYFPSKKAIIEALMERELEIVHAKFAAVLGDPDPAAAFRAIVRKRIETLDDHDGPIWVEIEAAAAREPEYAALLGRMEAAVNRHLVAVFARIAGIPEAEAAARFGAHARLIIMLVQGVSSRCVAYTAAPDAPSHREFAALVTRTIENILSEVAASGAPDRVKEHR
jgi:AcrR family transcriptional regulator